jgi:hypothetical protein
MRESARYDSLKITSLLTLGEYRHNHCHTIDGRRLLRNGGYAAPGLTFYFDYQWNQISHRI